MPKTGVDDFLAAGGTVNELKMLAKKFEPTDIGNIRMSRDDKLRAMVKDLERRWWVEEWKGRGGHSERDVALELIQAAIRSGKIHADGLRVKISWGVLQVGAKVARQTLSRALARLEVRGFLYRDNEGRKPDKTGAFVLRAKVDHKGDTRVAEEKVTRELRECDPGGLPSRALPEVTRLRWPRAKWKPTKKMIREHRLGVRTWIPEPRERIERLGKIRGAVVDALEVAGGELTLRELCEVLHHKRPRDVRRRVLPMLAEAGVIEAVTGDVVELATDWSERLDKERAAGGELEADELAEYHRKRKSRAYQERDKPLVSKPSPAGLSAVRRSHAARDARLQELARAEEERRRNGPPHALKALISRTLGQLDRGHLDRVRMGLLRDIAMEEGFDRRDVPELVHAMGYRVERLPEYDNQKFIYVRSAA
jgi:hypothetical protein